MAAPKVAECTIKAALDLTDGNHPDRSRYGLWLHSCGKVLLMEAEKQEWAGSDLALARECLNDRRLLAFFRAACLQVYPPHAIRIICDRLDQGRPLDEVFQQFSTGDMKYELMVKTLEPDRYEIHFGLRGPNTGDGGIWKVEFNGNDQVTAMEQPDFWTI